MEKIFKDSKGNTLSYGVWGDVKHPAILFFHGFPGSNIQGSALTDELKKHQLCLIAADRPGYGGSSPLKALSVHEHMEGLIELLELHGKKEFYVVGVSGGAPMAHIMASEYFTQVQSLTIVCGLATPNTDTWKSFGKFQQRALTMRKIVPEFILRPIINKVLRRHGPHERIKRFLSTLNQTDRNILKDIENYNLMVASMTDAIRQGAQGILWDSALFSQDWLTAYCEMDALAKIPVSYYHGTQDFILNYKMAEQMNKMLPHSTLEIFDGEGHYSLPLTKRPQIIEKLL
ncbi:alpha/beta fold hydrolase [Bdellovibrio sp. HCB337]|uniref:alpha/beta fold hydrolase n=1 Tax=Bdellovibrio sp. HCB337 TaxID=3394358 RepID=UPI0039A60CEB